MNLENIKKEIKNSANSKQAEILQRFFKTGKGEYGEGDIFLGIKVPEQRRISKKYQTMPLKYIQSLLISSIHEHRLISLFILIYQYKKADEKTKKKIFDFYLKNTNNVNSWDLVDLSAPNIVGNYLLDKPRGEVYRLAKSKILWERRIAILATFEFIKNNEYRDTLKISEILLKDNHDLIHKAVGWMLREVGKRNQAVEEKFLKKYYKNMPRTMLRYAIERFDEKKRKFYMKK
ncbi:DNA alkylation repair protein [Candidatus Woesearchaeota archaeon]|nr:DNA alkylation repair protein [Candidatus Woesearchaeota archaeon]